MPTIELEVSRQVWYAISKEVSQDHADHIAEVLAIGDNQAIQEALEGLIDARYDVINADDFEVVNASIDGKVV